MTMVYFNFAVKKDGTMTKGGEFAINLSPYSHFSVIPQISWDSSVEYCKIRIFPDDNYIVWGTFDHITAMIENAFREDEKFQSFNPMSSGKNQI